MGHWKTASWLVLVPLLRMWDLRVENRGGGFFEWSGPSWRLCGGVVALRVERDVLEALAYRQRLLGL